MTRAWLAVWCVIAALWVCTTGYLACRAESPEPVDLDGRPELLER